MRPRSMRETARRWLRIGLTGCLCVSAAAMAARGRAAETDTAPPAPSELPGVAAPAPVVQELRATLALAVQRFEARSAPGVLAYVSDQYRTGPFTKAGLREQLGA